MFAESATAFSPRQFKSTIGRYGPSFSGYGQQDSQEFLLFLLDGLHEDLNRIQKKPYIEKPDSTDEMVHDENALRQFATRCWEIYKARNDSIVTDLFAGMYKSTVTCPVCDKVSIIFDPFNNLTLQLPIENAWSHTIIFHPLNLPPINIEVDVNSTITMSQLKEHIGQKVQVDPKRLVIAEIYSHKFYKIYDDHKTIDEEKTQSNDVIVVFEVDEIPTNYPLPSSRKGGTNSYGTDDDLRRLASTNPSLSKSLLVPIFHRYPNERAHGRQRDSWALFAEPSFIVVSEEDAKDYEQILKKVLARVAIMTTKDILEQANESEEDDGVIMNAEDDDSNDSRVKAQSIQGEEGIVDVKMQETADDAAPQDTGLPLPRLKKSLPSALDPDRSVSPALTRLFELKALRGEGIIPTGWRGIPDNAPAVPFASRMPQTQIRRSADTRSAKATLRRRIANGGSDSDSSEDELASVPLPVVSADQDSSDDDQLPPVEELSAPKQDSFGKLKSKF